MTTYLLLLVLAATVPYVNSLQGVFVFDDFRSIASNPAVHHLLPKGFFADCFPETGLSGRPVVILSFSLNYALHGLRGPGYHAVNILLHTLCGLLLFGVLRRSFQNPLLHERYGRVASALACTISLLWLIHPLNTQSVTYLSGGRSELFMGFFYLLTLYCFLRQWRAGAVLACALGMMSKETMVSAPLFLLLYDRVFVSGSACVALRRKPLFYAGLAATLAVLFLIMATGPRARSVGFVRGGVTGWEYLLTQAGVILHYLRLSFWPDPLVIDYLDWPIVRNAARAAGPGLVILAGLAASFWLTFRKRPAGLLGIWFFFLLAPSSSFVAIPTEPATERRMYLPLIAVVAVAVLAGWELIRRFVPEDRRKAVSFALVGATALVFGLATVRQNALYARESTLLEHTVAHRPANGRARSNLAFALYYEGRFQEAEEQARRAIPLMPEYARSRGYGALGLALEKQGKREEAIEAYREALGWDRYYKLAEDRLRQLIGVEPPN
ncbi:MAG: tetratricopeptide repeat protein [Candidatus Omnitrophica bacterium]|nr:tetratricopeptide repeat protein [Candidatus Omnitrophota bacterium]